MLWAKVPLCLGVQVVIRKEYWPWWVHGKGKAADWSPQAGAVSRAVGAAACAGHSPVGSLKHFHQLKRKQASPTGKV